ncbi:MAG TPA: site-2 protease family protein [Polyangiaceae bacterium]|nr:site-2 protease family protein [Polyangiaceae bacterium]
MSQFADFLVWYFAFVFSTTCHEAAHALVAKRGGDATAYALGHVTLDPMPHIRREPIGMVLVPIISFFQLGWMVGWASVPYDPSWGARYPRRSALMSLAGPATNFVLAALALVAIRLLDSAGVVHSTYAGARLSFGQDFSSPLGALASVLSAMLQLNVILGLYNLIPVPPLDGAAVVEGLGPPGVRAFYQRIRYQPLAQLIGLVVAWALFPRLLQPAFRVVNLLLNA